MAHAMKILQREATVRLWQFALPVLWIGMVGAISFIEAPLKFQAPGITIPLGLGIGRLVFAALNSAEVALLLALTALSLWPAVARVSRIRLAWLGALWAVMLVKVVAVRPPLNARTDLVVAGADPGQSPWHYVYIGLDLATLVILLVCAVLAAREIARRLSQAR
jgi:hypothetical protein